MFVEHTIIIGILEASNVLEFVYLICVKWLRETEQYVGFIMCNLYVENAWAETPLSFNRYW